MVTQLFGSQSPYQSRGGETVPSGGRLAQGLQSGSAGKVASVAAILLSKQLPTVDKSDFSFAFNVRANIIEIGLSIGLQL